MKKEEINYERWLGQLKKTPPILENPEVLTEDIMRAVKAADSVVVSEASADLEAEVLNRENSVAQTSG